MATIFEIVEKVLSKKNHEVSDNETILSELVLIKDNEGGSLLFSALGANCILFSDDRIAIVDDTIDNVEVSYFDEEIAKELKAYLFWRMKFASKFNL